MIAKSRFRKAVALFLAITLFLPIVTHAETTNTLSDPDEQIIVETIIPETFLTEQTLNEALLS